MDEGEGDSRLGKLWLVDGVCVCTYISKCDWLIGGKE